MQEILPLNRGNGCWIFEIYNQNKTIGPFNGYLMITKDHHTIFEDASYKIMTLSVPSQNVSFVKRVEE